jgi:hypothetical protein
MASALLRSAPAGKVVVRIASAVGAMIAAETRGRWFGIDNPDGNNWPIVPSTLWMNRTLRQNAGALDRG